MLIQYEFQNNLPTPNLKQALAILWGVTLSYSDFAACYVQQQWSFLYHLFADVALCPRSWLHELCTAIKQINHHQSPARAECLSTLTREMTDNFCISLSTVLMCGANITHTNTGSDASVWSASANKTISEETGCFKCLSSGRTSHECIEFQGTVKCNFLNRITLTEQPNLLAVGLHET